MNQLNKIISDSSFVIEEGTYSIAKVGGEVSIKDCFLIAIDKLETTVIYQSNVNMNNVIDKKDGYVLIGIDVSVPFYSVGFIAEVTKCIAKHGINLLVVSTFSRDYVLVSSEYKDISRRVFISMGMTDRSLL